MKDTSLYEISFPVLVFGYFVCETIAILSGFFIFLMDFSGLRIENSTINFAIPWVIIGIFFLTIPPFAVAAYKLRPKI